ICYGRGGERVTITDANVVLGRLDPQGLLSVAHPVSVDALREAMVTQIGAALGLDAEAAAAAVVRIAD
ncbi:MAG: hypothetical protein GWN73_36795, partial [Actinobacteria bacterium]|nr:hypothetical protein [Actinomycetota bacterium]NIS36057.1 hypothetical protein [Actinomycetota bacterium]NIU70632.1 hypothetical protein [Actinomycetota bacterium]NIW32535.1 hypothetical protein [Actinomycetota bacterium]